MTDWIIANEITGIVGSEAESEMLVLLRWLKNSTKEIDLLEADSTHAIFVHQAGELGTLDEAEIEWENSAIIIVDANVIQSGLLKPLLEHLELSEKLVYIGVVGDVSPVCENDAIPLDGVELIRLKYLSSLSLNIRVDKYVKITIFAILPHELKGTTPSLKDRFRKRQIIETRDNLAGRERWFKKRNE